MTEPGSVLDLSPVVPVIEIDDEAGAVPVATALRDGGLRIVEITLRTPAALRAVERIVAAVPEVTVGAGTVRSGEQARRAVDAGAAFLVSPGATAALLEALSSAGVPYLPGVATPSEMMRLAEIGVTEAKLFPAEAVGGVALLKAVAGPLPELRFCPTGGITARSAPGYLALPNVACVGGSWVATREAIARQDWAGIAERARAAAGLRPG